MGLQEIESKILNKNLEFRRSYETRVFWFTEQNPPVSVVEIHQYDNYHDIILLLEVNLLNLKIQDYGVRERRVPYKSCPLAIKNYSYLIGSEISETKIKKSFPERQIGCLHLNEMLEIGSKVFSSAYGFYLKSQNIPAKIDEYKMDQPGMEFDDRIEHSRHWWMKDRVVRNSCYSFSDLFRKEEIYNEIKDYPSITNMMVRQFRNHKSN
jgi:hypothetical protein